MSDITFNFGTVGAPQSTPKKPGGSVGAIQRIAGLGLDSLELGWVRGVHVTEAACAEIKRTAEEYRVALSIHASYYINVNAEQSEWPSARQRLMEAAQFGHLAGATDIIFHPGSYFERPRQEVLPQVVERLQDCIKELRATNNPVTLRSEAMGKSALLGSLDDVLDIARAVPGVEPCLDFAHMHARAGNGTMNTYAEWMHVLEKYAEALGEAALQRMHIHLSGIEYTAKGERKHLPMQEADLDFQAILAALHASGCGGRILCESPGEDMEQDALRLQKKWRELASASA